MIWHEGMEVETTDGHFGSLRDVVMVSDENLITHLVVGLDGELERMRLVPKRLISETSDGLRIEMDSREALELERKIPSDFVRIDAPEKTTHHQLRFGSALARPFVIDTRYHAEEAPKGLRIPIDEVELMVGSDVVSRNDRALGRIVGFLTFDHSVHAVAVRSGLPGFASDVIVALDSIEEVIADMVLLNMDRFQFKALETTDLFASEKPIVDLTNAALQAAEQGRSRLRDKLARKRS